MASYQDLFKFETAMMSSSVVILNAYGISASFVQGGANNLTTPRVELQSLTGGPIGHVKNTSYSGSQYDAFAGNIQALVVTERALNAPTHADYTSKVISLLSNLRNYNTGSVMPNHYVSKIDFKSTNVRVDAESNMDFSALTMEYVLWIRPSAWPTS